MPRRWILASLAVFILTATHAPALDTPEAALAGDPTEPEQPFSADEGDKAVPVLTPISVYDVKKPYDGAKETLQKAKDLWKNGQAEAASDAALEAYDALVEIHFPRKQKKARRTILAEREQAATVYIQASLAYIKQWVEKEGHSPEIHREARARLDDLRDVSQDYNDLVHLVHAAEANYP